MSKWIDRNTRVKAWKPGHSVRKRFSPGEPESESKPRVFLSGLILAGLLAGASMLPNNESEGRLSSDEVGSLGAGAVRVTKVDLGGEEHTATDANDSAGTQDRR